MTAGDNGEFLDGVLNPRGCFTIYDAHVSDRGVTFQPLIQNSRIDRLVLWIFVDLERPVMVLANPGHSLAIGAVN